MITSGQEYKQYRLWKTITFFLDFIYPRDELDKILDTYTANTLITKVGKAQNLPDKKCFAPLAYNNPLSRRIIWNLKYKRNTHALNLSSTVLYGAIYNFLQNNQATIANLKPILIGIPMSDQRLKERGYNQAELIVKRLLRADKNNIFSKQANKLLKKIKNTPAQTSLSNRKTRLQNLHDCFAVVDVKAVNSKMIILIDDVITTGATMREARKTLLKAGAREVLCFAVAH
jgi:ComF family protein